jgi:hypothetical protein
MTGRHGNLPPSSQITEGHGASAARVPGPDDEYAAFIALENTAVARRAAKAATVDGFGHGRYCTDIQISQEASLSSHSSSQTEVPSSFIAIYSKEAAGRVRKLALPLASLQERHEFCEDLAQALVDSSRARLFELRVTEEDVLHKVFVGLTASEEVLSRAESQWVVRRLAELLNWEPMSSQNFS